MSLRRRKRAARRQGWAGWVSDARGPAVSLHADRPPSDETIEAIEAILAIRDAVINAWRLAEREAGRWEDDGGPSEPDGVHRTYSLVAGRRA